MKLDEKLVRLRKEKGLTQLELAEAVKVSRQAVSKWESGGGLPSIENLWGLSELYGVPVDYLLNEEEIEPVDYLLNESDEKGTESSVDNKDIPQKNRVDIKSTIVKWSFIILLLFIITGLVWLFYDNQEKYFSVSDMKGEEVMAEPDGNFSVGW